LVEDTQVLHRDCKMVTPKGFWIVQLADTITICSILDTPTLKQHYTQQCSGKVWDTPSDHMSKTAIQVKLINNRSTSMRNSLPSLPSQTLGGIVCRPHWTLHSQRSRCDRNWLYVSYYDRPSFKLVWNSWTTSNHRWGYSHGYKGAKGHQVTQKH
jgi:hypothetical protein